MVAGVSAILLFIIMFLPWYGVDASVDVPGGGDVTVASSPSFSAWEVFSFIDILLFLLIALTIAMVAARAAGAMPADLPAPPGLIIAGIGALGVLLILYRLLDVPVPDFSSAGGEVDATRKIGVFLGLLATAGVAAGGYMASTERASGTAPGSGGGAPPAGPGPGAPPPGGSPGGTAPPPGGSPGGAPPQQGGTPPPQA